MKKQKEEKFPLQPEDNRIIIRPLPEQEQKTKQGIYIPANNKSMPKGEVMAVSNEYTGRAKVGDVVIYTENSGFPCVANGRACVIVYKHDILAVVL